jgi:cytosine/adenosine deaminase-related metal-dependent hydrolase
MAEVLGAAPFLVAHVNDCDDAAIRTLARTGTSVAYCPRASAYFGAERHFGPHRYRDMLGAGINVALGTDSIVNLPESAVGAAGMSILDEMRFLYRRDGTDPRVLLGMGTVNGARALGLPADAFAFGVGGEMAGLASVEVGDSAPGSFVRAVVESQGPVRLQEPRGV